jgi:hypothetical protein
MSVDGATVYATALTYPANNTLDLGIPRAGSSGVTASLLRGATRVPLTVTIKTAGLSIALPPVTLDAPYAWSIALTGLQ